ncbi:MAG: DUF1016 domain-containing protein [Planctomycetes bacterium]|nr:DUF1016 domain-containing protein [Planctomycetota bacterium]
MNGQEQKNSSKTWPTEVRSDFTTLLADIKSRIQAAQTRAVLAVNAELVRLYWDIGRIIHDQRREGWGAAVIPRRRSGHSSGGIPDHRRHRLVLRDAANSASQSAAGIIGALIGTPHFARRPRLEEKIFVSGAAFSF